jgi:hypothetical protein
MSSPSAAPRAAVSTSHARAEASRKNGAKSHGPRTEEGKARSAQNALKHGLRAQRYVVLPEEDAAEFAELEAALIEELAPVGTLPTVLARRVAVAAWRLARADRIEVELFAERSWGANANPGLAMIRDGNGTRSFETLQRYRGAAMAEFWRALKTLKALQAEARAHAAAEVEAPMRARPAVAPGPAAVLLDRPAAAKEPNEPESRGDPGEPGRPGDSSNSAAAPRVRHPSPASISPLPLSTPGPGALRPRPIEPETLRTARPAPSRRAPGAPCA